MLAAADHSEALAGLGPLIFRVCKVEPSFRQRKQEGLLGTIARDRTRVAASGSVPSECSQIPSEMCRERLPPPPCFGPQEDDPMPRYHFAVSTQLGTTTRTGRKCQTTLPLGTTPSDHSGGTSTTGWTMEVRQRHRIVWQIPFETVEPNNDG